MNHGGTEDTEIVFKELTGALIGAAHDAGFADIRPVVELRGHCEACA